VGHLRVAANFSHVFVIGDNSGTNLVAGRTDEEGLGFLQPVRLADVVLLHSGFRVGEKSRSELKNSHSLFHSTHFALGGRCKTHMCAPLPPPPNGIQRVT
jgi:hypothetical protein